MGTIIDMIDADHRQLRRIFERVEDGHISAIPELCHFLRAHSQIEEQVFYPALSARWSRGDQVLSALHQHHEMRELVMSLEQASDITQDYVARAGHLIVLAREHMAEEERMLLPRAPALLGEDELIAMADDAQRLRTRSTEDTAATSDADGSWTHAPLTQDPGIDRSVEAVIRRSSEAGGSEGRASGT